ncbi:MAG: type II secretion system F family protein [Planctomycetia bacterium]|nr:type II secretion system F family protein [Planctomycetia bacterium]
MPDFKYKARNKIGKEIQGRLSANTKKDVLDLLSRQGMFPISVEDANKGDIDLGKLFKRRPPDSLIAAFLSQLAELLENGVPVLTAFQVLGKQATNPVLKEVVNDIHDQIADGQEIDVAFASHPRIFNDLTISIIRAGAEGAFLEDSLKRTAKFMEQQAELKGKITGAMIYPAMLCIVGTIVVTVLVVFFVPKFEPMFDQYVDGGHELPFATISLLAFRDFLSKYGIYALSGLILGGFWLRFQMMTKWGRQFVDRWKLKIPIIGPIALNSAVSRLCRVLGTLLQNGVPILRALEISSHSTGNSLLATAVEKAVESVSAGEPLSKPLSDANFMPPQVMAMISISEESNTLENVLINVSESIERELSKKIDLLVRLLEPIMLLIMASAVFYIIIALLLPIFKMTEAA